MVHLTAAGDVFDGVLFCAVLFYERRRSRVVRAVQKVVVRSFEAGLCHANWKALSVNLAINGYFFRIKEG